MNEKLTNINWVLMKIVPAAGSLLVLISLVTACASGPKITSERPVWVEENKNIERPKERKSDLAWDAIENTMFDQGSQLLDIERDFRIVTDNRQEARNVNAYDEVPNSSWFTNRHHLFPLTPEQLQTGPSLTPGPDTSAAWQLFRPKVGGATPGFWIQDARGDQYILKFDPVDNPEIATGAAAIGGRFFHACGYNVPQETIVYWRPENLQIKEGVTIKTPDGQKLPFTQQVLDSILSMVRREPDGSIRSLASLALPNANGPFSYSGRRHDDPNDWCPHQDRRELRGLYVLASFVNHYDTKDQNTFTTFETVDGKSFVKHYLIDFGSTLGADSDAAKPLKKGYANVFDLRDAFASLFTFGLKTWGWQHGGPEQFPSVGYFESEIFQPHKFDPIQPNPAFEEMTDRDAFWGAKIVMSFDEADIRALVKSGQYSDPQAEEYVVKTLLERRAKIGRHWFTKVNPLDEFAWSHRADGFHLWFTDLAVKYGFAGEGESSYRFCVKFNGETIVPETPVSNNHIVIPISDNQKLNDAMRKYGGDLKAESPKIRVEISTSLNGGGWSKPTLVWLSVDAMETTPTVVGIEHLD